MNTTNLTSFNDFKNLSAATLSKLFVLAQTPATALLNKKMYFISQQIPTIAEYVGFYVKNIIKQEPIISIRSLFDRYPRLKRIENICNPIIKEIGILSYEALLHLALDYHWQNVLAYLLGVYMLIEKNTSRVIYTHMLPTEDECVDKYIKKLPPIVDKYNAFLDIDISENTYLRHLITAEWASKLQKKTSTDYSRVILESFLKACKNKLESPQPSSSFYFEKKIYITDSKIVTVLVILAIHSICKANDIEMFKMVLDMNIKLNTSINSSIATENSASLSSLSKILEFIQNYGYQNQINRIVYISCMYHAIDLSRKKLINYLDSLVPAKDQNYQLKFDLAIYLRNNDLALKMLKNVEPTTSNIAKIIQLVDSKDNIFILKHLLANEYSLEGGPGETALTTAISLDDFETAAYISRKYVDTVTTSVILQTIINDNMRLLEEFKSIGIDITKVGEKGVWCACINKNIEILRLLTKNGTKVQATSGDMLGVICNESYRSREIIFELVTNSTNSSNNAAKLHGCAETGKTLKFGKIIKAFLGRLNIHGRKAMMIMSQLALGNIWYMQENIKGMYVVSREAIWCYAMEWTVKQLLFNIVDHIEKNKLHHTILEAKITGPISVFKKTIAGETVLSDCDYELAKSNIVDRNLGMIGLLIDGGLDANLSNHLVLRTAYKSGDIGWIDYFIEKGAKLGTEGYCGLDEACQSDNIEVLKHWFRNGGTVPTDPKHNGVRVASSVGNFEMVRLLVKNGACLSDPTYSGIKEACELNHQEILKYLVKNNAAVGDLEYYQWENAVMTGDVKLVNMILEYYANMRMSKKGKERALEENCTLTLPKTQTPESDPEYEYLKVVLEHSSIIDEYDLVEDLWMAKALRRNKTATLLSKWNMESFACRIEEFKSKKDYFI